MADHVQFIRDNERDYPGIIKRVQDKFLEEAGVIVQETAVRLVPVQTGNLRGSINRRREGDAEIIGTNVEYAEYVEYGVRGRSGQPYMRPAIDLNRRNLMRKLAELVKAQIEFGR